MVKIASLHNARVLKVAGLLVLAAFAVAFLAFPMVSFAKTGGTGGKTIKIDAAFTVLADGTKIDAADSSFDAATSTAPTDGTVDLVQITVNDQQSLPCSRARAWL